MLTPDQLKAMNQAFGSAPSTTAPNEPPQPSASSYDAYKQSYLTSRSSQPLPMPGGDAAGQQAADIMNSGPLGAASKLFSGTGKLIGSAAGMAGEGLAALIDKNVRDQMMNSSTEDFKRMFPFLGQFVDESAKQVALRNAGRVASTGLELAGAAEGAPELGAAEKAAEAGGAIKKTSTLGKIVKGGLTGAKEGAKYGAAFGLSQGVDNPNATLGSVAKETAEGGLGGAAIGAGIGIGGGTLAAGAGLAADTYRGISKILKPDMTEAFTRGVAPTGMKAAQFTKTAQTVMPDLLHTAKGMGIDIGTSEKPVDDLLKVAAQAKKGIWAQFQGLLGAHGDATIDGNKIADAMVSSMDKRFIAQNPAAAERIEAKANTYRSPMSVNDAEEFLKSANGELNTYYAKNKVGQNAAMSDPEVSHVVKEANALREALYGKLDEVAGKGKDAKLLKQRYGALTETEGQLLKRQAVLARLKPVSLAEQIHYPLAVGKAVAHAATGNIPGAISGMAEAGAAKLIKESQTNEEMIRKAFRAATKNELPAYGEVLPGKGPKASAAGDFSYHDSAAKADKAAKALMAKGISPEVSHAEGQDYWTVGPKGKLPSSERGAGPNLTANPQAKSSLQTKTYESASEAKAAAKKLGGTVKESPGLVGEGKTYTVEHAPIVKEAAKPPKEPSGFGTKRATTLEDIPENPNLTGKDAKLQLASRQHTLENYDTLLAKNREDKGNVINPDDFKKLYRDLGYKGTNAAAVHEASSHLAKVAYTEALADNPGESVIGLAGGSGAGKSTAIKASPELTKLKKEAAVVLDSNASDYGKTLDKIKEAELAHKTYQHFYVYRDPEEAFLSTIERGLNNPEEMGRLVPAKIVAENTIGSWKVADKLAKTGRVPVDTFDNSLGFDKYADKTNAKRVSIQELRNKIDFPSVEVLTNRLKNLAREVHERGVEVDGKILHINKAQLDALLAD